MKNALLIFVIIITYSAYGQKIPEIGMNVRITESDKTIVAEIRPLNTELKTNSSATYFWYGSGSIHHTQGGYSGKLLNGNYSEYFLNKNLKEQGAFNKGLRNGNWKTWNESGLISQSVTYSKGIRSGLFIFFDEKGKPKQSGNYKNNELNGRITSFYQDTIKVIIYKNGKAIPSKSKSGFWNKLKFFKRHSKTTGQASKKTIP